MGAARVLIADGDTDSRTVYRILLQHRGYEVLETSNGEEALDLARTGDVAAVVTELTLRNGNGLAVLRGIRSDPALQGLPVLVLTARGFAEDRERAERAGCTRFLLKPLEPQELARQIQELLAGDTARRSRD